MCIVFTSIKRYKTGKLFTTFKTNKIRKMAFVNGVNNGFYNDHSFIPWVLLLTTFALWGLSHALSSVFGGFREYGARRAAGAGVGAGAAPVVGAPVAPAAAGGAVAAPASYNGLSRSTGYITDGLKTLLWLLLIPILFNSFWGFSSHVARNLIISIFAIGIIWAFLRGLAHIFHFLHRILDFGLFVLVPLAVAAAALAIDDHHADD